MYTGGTTFVLNEKGHKWYYMNRQHDNEVVVFKSFDSDDKVTKCRLLNPLENRARFADLEILDAAHSSFLPSFIPLNAAPRQSIEVRAMVYTYPESLDDARDERL
jgi:hypothetical protein